MGFVNGIQMTRCASPSARNILVVDRDNTTCIFFQKIHFCFSSIETSYCWVCTQICAMTLHHANSLAHHPILDMHYHSAITQQFVFLVKSLCGLINNAIS